MMKFRRLLEQDAKQRRRDRTITEQHLEKILESQQRTENKLAEILAIMSYRDLAKRYLETLEN